MSIIDMIFRGGGDLADPQTAALAALMGGVSTPSSGEVVSQRSAMSLMPYYRCMASIAEDTAKLPLWIKRVDRLGNKEIMVDHPVQRLLSGKPNPEMSNFAFRETLVHHILGWGRGAAEIETDNRGNIKGLWPIHPSRLRLRRDQQTDLLYWEVLADADYDLGRKQDEKIVGVKLPYDRIFHVEGMSPNGLVGYSVLRFAAESIGLGLALQRFGGSFFKNGAAVRGVIEIPTELSPEAYERFKESWASQYQGPSNAGGTPLLEGGAKYAKTSVPPEEAQFLESRKFSAIEICGWFRMPPHKIGILDRATWSNIEQQNLDYVTDTLGGVMGRLEVEIACQLLSGEGLVAEHDVRELLRGDMAARGTYYTQQFHTGAMSINDIRRAEGMPPIGEAGDEHYVPVNLQSAETASSTQQNQESPDNNTSAVALATSRILSDAVGRVHRRIRHQAERLRGKEAGKVREAIDKYSTEYPDRIRSSLEPAIASLCPLYGADETTAGVALAMATTLAEGCTLKIAGWAKSLAMGADFAEPHDIADRITHAVTSAMTFRTEAPHE